MPGEDRNINNFQQFNEATLRDNKGITPEYFDRVRRDVEDEARRKLREGEAEHPSRIIPMVEELIRLQGGQVIPPPPPMGGPRGGMPAFGEEARQQHMGNIPQGPSIRWVNLEKKERIEELANEIINDQYGNLIDRLNIELDIKLIDPDELNQIRNSDEMEDTPDQEPNKEYEETDDEDFISDVYKRKLTNVITQGSAKNTHRLIHLHKDKIDDVDPDIFELMDRLIKSNEVAEVQQAGDLSEEERAAMIRGFMNGYEKVEYGSEDDEDEIEDGMEDIDIDALINGDEEEMDKFDEEFEDFTGSIKITARGFDLMVLLHEAVKGIYEVLGAASLPEDDEDRAQDIMMNTDTLADEVEDLIYGNRIRQDLLAFVNSYERVNELGTNGFEYIWGALVSMESKKFLSIFKDAIIDKTGLAERWLKETVDTMIEEEEEYQRELEEYERDMEDWKNYQSQSQGRTEREKPTPRPTPTPEVEETSEVDYSEMGQGELKDLLDKALDDNDFAKAGEISKYLN